MKPETQFRQGRVLPFLKTLKHTWYTGVQQVSICGVPDLILCVQGLFIAVELKASGGIVSKLQKYNIDEIKRCGGIAMVVSPDNWESFKTRLTRMDQGETDD